MAKRRKKPWNVLSLGGEINFASSASRDRVPSHLEMICQLQLYGAHGVTAAKMADTLGVTVHHALTQLRLLRGIRAHCEDDEPTAWSKWFYIDNNPKTVSKV